MLKKTVDKAKKNLYYKDVAPVAELVDAHASGACWGFPVKVQVFSGAPKKIVSMIFLLTLKKFMIKKSIPMADLAQLVRALVCGTRCREFESHNPPHIEKPSFEGFFIW